MPIHDIISQYWHWPVVYRAASGCVNQQRLRREKYTLLTPNLHFVSSFWRPWVGAVIAPCRKGLGENIHIDKLLRWSPTEAVPRRVTDWNYNEWDYRSTPISPSRASPLARARHGTGLCPAWTTGSRARVRNILTLINNIWHRCYACTRARGGPAHY